MEKRPYFVLGDVVANCVTGALSAWATSAVVPGQWGMATGMVLGMLLGMVLGTILGFAFAPLFGAMEVMLPAMLSGMLAGMAGGMLAAREVPLGVSAWQIGIGIGALTVVYSYVVQIRIGNEVS